MSLTAIVFPSSRGKTPRCYLVKPGGRLLKHARYYWLLMEESSLAPRLFGSILPRIAPPPSPSGSVETQSGADLEEWLGAGKSVCSIDWKRAFRALRGR